MYNSSYVVIGGSILSEIEEIKYLGVIIDNKIITYHISHMSKISLYGYWNNFQGKKILKRKTPINLYHSYIYPYLIYCIDDLGNASN